MRRLQRDIPAGIVLIALCFGVTGVAPAFAADNSGSDANQPDNVKHENVKHEDDQEAAPGEHQESEGHEKGVPLGFKADLAFWSLVVFIVFVFVLWKFAWGPLSKTLDERESRIARDLAEAEQARQKAEQMLAEHQQKLDAVQDEVREIIAEARRDAEHTKQEIIDTAQQEADATRQRAVAEINRARDIALKELFDTMSSQVTQATEYVLGRSLSPEDQNRLINEALSYISQQN